MKANKHTPGPWTLNPQSCNAHDIDSASWKSLAIVVTGDIGGSEGGANAQLIAAAPEMIEALETVVRWAELHGLTRAETIHHGVYAEVPAIAIARAAIAKATAA